MHSSKRKFIVKVCCLFIPVAVYLLYMNTCQFYYMDDEFPMWQQEKDYVSESQDYNDIVTIGDSICKGNIIPDEIGDGVINIALGGSTPIEMYYALSSYIQNHRCPQKVIILFNPSDYTSFGCFLSRDCYFHYLTNKQFREVYKVADKYSDNLFTNEDTSRQVREYSLFCPEKYMAAIYNSHFVNRITYNEQKYNEMFSSKGNNIFGMAESCSDANDIVNAQDFCVDSVIKDYLYKIMNLCAKNGIETIVEQPPFNTATVNGLTDEYKGDLTLFFSELKAAYPNATIVDKLNVYPDDCFGDTAHLNQHGAEKYTAYIKERYALNE